MTDFETVNFPHLPTKEALTAALERIGAGTASDIRLFSHSSCSPSFHVQLRDGIEGHRRVVLRGRQQNDVVSAQSYRPEFRDLRREVFILKHLGERKVRCPKPLLDGRIFRLSARDTSDGRRKPFPFYLMSYIDGIASTRKIVAVPHKDQLYYLDRITRIYAQIADTRDSGFGVLGANGRAARPTETFEDCLATFFDFNGRLLVRRYDRTLGAAVLRFAERAIPKCFAALGKAGYVSEPRLVYYDSLGGNMLISGRRLGLVDPSYAGYFDPLTEFIAMILGLPQFLRRPAPGGTMWTYACDQYRHHGGMLPPDELIPLLLQVLTANWAAQMYLYYLSHADQSRRRRATDQGRMLRRLITLKSPRMDDLLRAAAQA